MIGDPNFIENCRKVKNDSFKRTLEISQQTSETLKKSGDGIASLENNIGCQEKLINHAEENAMLLNQNLNDMHKTLSESNNSRSKCISATITASGVTSTILGSSIAIGIGSATAVILGSTIALFGGVIALYGGGPAIYSSFNSCKKPNRAMKNSNVEQGIQSNLHELVPLQ